MATKAALPRFGFPRGEVELCTLLDQRSTLFL